MDNKLKEKKEHQKIKLKIHPRNKHRERYNFQVLISTCPELAEFIRPNAYKDLSIDFFDPKAVKMLNSALLKHYYGIDFWEIPTNYLCPPIPGRADYIHYMADLLASMNKGTIPTGNKIKCLDVGMGANCIYPILGHVEYGWAFVGSDIDPVSIESASTIIKLNPSLKGKVELRLQKNKNDIFQGIIQKDEKFDFTLCNPPFHASMAENQAASLRKLSNLKNKKITKPRLNFGGQNNELWCEGGEERFVRDMIIQSKKISSSCFWFSTLISKKENLKLAYFELDKAKAVEVKTIEMSQGNKISRILAWTFLLKEEQKKWVDLLW
ncbi:MAG: 23S rRNA (adenine(1618)-N(6))-methyltransferase RlmF [Bacteroidetes bacterium]|nr:23S rRNA (adenine(1618)-N(6))-methyltransferase RlmF [Bacteroidota bacterium]HET6244548.1 23S rRNA (adenine(1618)-N(6))-methyltransferase RlmF [Bacteroidia bacterium]